MEHFVSLKGCGIRAAWIPSLQHDSVFSRVIVLSGRAGQISQMVTLVSSEIVPTSLERTIHLTAGESKTSTDGWYPCISHPPM